MGLLRFKNFRLEIDPELLTLRCFKDLWDRDKSKGKVRALQELGYIYFMHDPRSDYMMFSDEVERHNEVCKGQGIKGFKVDALLGECIELYKSFLPLSYLVLEDMRASVERLRVYLRSLDMNERDSNGRPIYSLSNLTSALKSIPAIIGELRKAEDSLKDDIESGGRLRGNGKKSLLDDGFIS